VGAIPASGGEFPYLWPPAPDNSRQRLVTADTIGLDQRRRIRAR
jgi:hypothetical protein